MGQTKERECDPIVREGFESIQRKVPKHSETFYISFGKSIGYFFSMLRKDMMSLSHLLWNCLFW